MSTYLQRCAITNAGAIASDEPSILPTIRPRLQGKGDCFRESARLVQFDVDDVVQAGKPLQVCAGVAGLIRTERNQGLIAPECLVVVQGQRLFNHLDIQCLESLHISVEILNCPGLVGIDNDRCIG